MESRMVGTVWHIIWHHSDPKRHWNACLPLVIVVPRSMLNDRQSSHARPATALWKALHTTSGFLKSVLHHQCHSRLQKLCVVHKKQWASGCVPPSIIVGFWNWCLFQARLLLFVRTVMHQPFMGRPSWEFAATKELSLYPRLHKSHSAGIVIKASSQQLNSYYWSVTKIISDMISLQSAPVTVPPVGHAYWRDWSKLRASSEIQWLRHVRRRGRVWEVSDKAHYFSCCFQSSPTLFSKASDASTICSKSCN